MEEQEKPNQPRPWQDDLAFEVWRHFAGVGGVDKDMMVRIATWLLGFSAAILGFILTNGLESSELKEPLATGLLATGGLVISLVAAAISLLYGGYANWNWAIADQIAKAYDWHYLLPVNSPLSLTKETRNQTHQQKSHYLTKFALQLAAPQLPHEKLAPVFLIFFWVSILSFATHLALLIWSLL